jgi:uncharacterized protein (TIGR03083 family)
MDELWSTVAAERGALAADLAHLADDRWSTPSLCAGWSVRQVLAHLTATASLNPVSFIGALVRSGFDFSRFAEARIERHLGESPVETLAGFRAVQSSTSSPPGPRTTWLGEVLVHSEDIRRPLGIAHTYPVDAQRQAADFYAGSNALIGTKKRIAGLRLQATDTDWSTGRGDQVEGPMTSLLLAMTGRQTACEDLTGPGVAVLRQR